MGVKGAKRDADPDPDPWTHAKMALNESSQPTTDWSETNQRTLSTGTVTGTDTGLDLGAYTPTSKVEEAMCVVDAHTQDGHVDLNVQRH